MCITKAGLGGIPIQRLSDEEATTVIQRAIDLGMNWIDTANGYGTSEGRIGLAMAKYDRDSIHIFSKAAGSTPEDLASQIDLSLERLRVDYLDLYQFHMPGEDDWERMLTNGTVDTMLRYRDEGKIRHIGASAHKVGAALKILEHPDIETMQFPFNFIMYDEADGIRNRCRATDTGFIAMKPLGGGVFPNAGPCIRFLMQYPEIVTDPGCETVEQVEEIAALVEAGSALSQEDSRELARLRGELGKRFCRRCGYCEPCPEDVPVTSLMMLDSLFKRLPPDMLLTDYWLDAVDKLSNCTDCGECESKCPYDLPIRETMASSVEDLRKLQESQ